MRKELEELQGLFAKYELYDYFDMVSRWLADTDLYSSDIAQFLGTGKSQLLKEIRSMVTNNLFKVLISDTMLNSVKSLQDIDNLRFCLNYDSRSWHRIAQALKTANSYQNTLSRSFCSM